MIRHPACKLAAVGKPDARQQASVCAWRGRAKRNARVAGTPGDDSRTGGVRREVIVQSIPVAARASGARFDDVAWVLKARCGRRRRAGRVRSVVGADARHGTLARVIVTPRRAGARALDSVVREALDRFSVRYEITWKEPQP
jgi:hypothetical protein